MERKKIIYIASTIVILVLMFLTVGWFVRKNIANRALINEATTAPTNGVETQNIQQGVPVDEIDDKIENKQDAQKALGEIDEMVKSAGESL